MERPNLPANQALRPASNKGRVVGRKRPLRPQNVWAIRIRLELAKDHRDLALFNMAIESKLCGYDLVKRKVVDVVTPGRIKERASIAQSETQKPVRCEISEGTRAFVETCLEDELVVGSEHLWPGRVHISTRQYARIVRDWVTPIGLEALAITEAIWINSQRAAAAVHFPDIRCGLPSIGVVRFDCWCIASLGSIGTIPSGAGGR